MPTNYNKHFNNGPRRESVENPNQGVPPVEEEKNENEQRKVMVANCVLLNLREKPAKDARVLSVLKEGETLIANGESDGWVKVLVTNTTQEGYVMCDYIEEV